MSHTTIQIGFYISLFLILPIGAFLVFKWGRRIIKPIAKDIDKSKHIQLEAVAFKTTIYMVPALLVFILFAVPVFYFANLKKKERYCREIIKVNNLQKTDAMLTERCSCLDINELYAKPNLD